MRACPSPFLPRFFALLLALAIIHGVAGAAAGPLPQRRSINAGPDPLECPLPPIQSKNPLKPGPSELPERSELPSLLLNNKGEEVQDPKAWAERRKELIATLQYYYTGRIPPAPTAIEVSLLHSERLPMQGLEYRLISVRFATAPQACLQVGLLFPADGVAHPFIIAPFGSAPGAENLPLQAKGPTQGRGLNVLMPPLPQPKSPPPPTSPPSEKQPTLAARVAEFSLALSRGYGIALFNLQDCAEDTTLRCADGSWAFRQSRFPSLYPEYDWGVLAAWAWGMSRVADALQRLPFVDASKLIVTGVSRAGKAALIATAFDTRLMGAPVVTGGGGFGAFRASGLGRGGREGLGEMMNKYPNWFSPHLREFWGHTEKLPFDQHFLVALCAPRPLIALEGESDPVSLPNAVRLSLFGALPVYELLGAPDSLALNVGRHGHAFTDEGWNALLDFADQKLRGMKPTRLLSLSSAQVPLPLPKSNFNVLTYGARGDGLTLDTRAFQEALDSCALSGGGEVYVPAGRYRIGSIQLGNRTILRLEDGVVLVGSSDPADYPMIDVRWEGRLQPGRRALIHAAHVQQSGVVGPGRIEGDPSMAAGQNPRGTPVLEAMDCTGVLWDGFTVIQGGNWATHPCFCTDVQIRNLTIRGARDGIDVDSCSQVRIQNCDIDTGDDSISLKSGRGLDGARIGRPTEDVLISDCVLRCRHFACIGIGSESSGGVRSVLIKNTVFTDSATYAIYIKTREGRAGIVEDIHGEDLAVRAGGFLRINMVGAGNTNTADDPVQPPLGTPLAKNISFERVQLSCTTLVEAVRIPPNTPLHGLRLSKLTGTCSNGMRLANVRGLVLEDLQIKTAEGPLLCLESCTGSGLENARPLSEYPQPSK